LSIRICVSPVRMRPSRRPNSPHCECCPFVSPSVYRVSSFEFEF